MKRFLFLIITCFIFISCATFGNYENSNNPAKRETIKSYYDEFRDITFYNHSMDLFSDIKFYVGQKSDEKYMRCYTYYSGKDWIFFNTVYLIGNGERFIKKIDYFSKDTEVSNGYVYERIDFPLEESDIEILYKILQSDDIKLRLSGDHNYKDYKLSKKNISTLREMIMFYYNL